MRRPAGFTIIEMIVVLLLMSIIAATVLGRSITSTDLDLSAQTDKLRNHLRYAQSMAMKTAYNDYPVWGIKSAGGQYWLFRGTNPDNAANEVRLAGMDYSGTSNRISTADLSVSLNGFTVFFDRIGRPYSAYSSSTNKTALSGQMTVTVTSGSQSRAITVEPETGLVR
ncbi:MAG: type II secretion system protein [Desulfobacterales bacterium]